MRQSNIELCRILAILMVVIVHSGFQTFGVPTNLSDTSIPMLLLQAFSIIGVNVFVLITGFFSAKIKVKSLVNLVYICFFCFVIIIAASIILGYPISPKKLFFISTSNWFIPCYLCLLFFTPFLNIACEKLSKKELLGGVISFTLISAWVGYFPAIAMVNPGYNDGLSVISFINLYLIARSFKLYGIPKWLINHSTKIYIFSSLLLTLCAYVVLHKGLYTDKLMVKIFAYNNPIVILSAISFFVCFTKINISNKFVNHIAQSTLTVLLLHATGLTMSYTIPFFHFLRYDCTPLVCVSLWIVIILSIFTISVIIDQARLLSFKLVESKLTKIAQSLKNKLLAKFNIG